MTLQRALVLEERERLAIRDIDLPMETGPGMVKIKLHTVGVCGSDVHYYQHGKIGPFVVEEPMVLGHEAAGTVVKVGADVEGLRVGDRVCMEPGIPDADSKATRLGIYNLDPSVRFWATPPVHGVLTPHVVHPAAFTFKLPDNVSFAEGAMVEPFAVGMQAAAKARITPGDTAVVVGAGPIGIMVAIAAIAGGCARAIVSDVSDDKLAIAGRYPGIVTVNIRKENLQDKVMQMTDGWGADILFECSGSKAAWASISDPVRPGGTVLAVGLPIEPVPVDITRLSSKEIRMESVFRYAHQYERAIALLSSGKVDLKPLVSATYDFDDAIVAFERAAEARPSDVKIQILLQA